MTTKNSKIQQKEVIIVDLPQNVVYNSTIK